MKSHRVTERFKAMQAEGAPLTRTKIRDLVTVRAGGAGRQ